MNRSKEVIDQKIRNLASKETDKAVKELKGESRPSAEGIKTDKRNI